MMVPKIVLTGCQIICSKIITADVTLSKDIFFLIKGIVYSPTGEQLPNAAVEIFLINSTIDPAQEECLGVTFTLKDGSFGISVPRINGTRYKLTVYSPG